MTAFFHGNKSFTNNSLAKMINYLNFVDPLKKVVSSGTFPLGSQDSYTVIKGFGPLNSTAPSGRVMILQ